MHMSEIDEKKDHSLTQEQIDIIRSSASQLGVSLKPLLEAVMEFGRLTSLGFKLGFSSLKISDMKLLSDRKVIGLPHYNRMMLYRVKRKKHRKLRGRKNG